MKIRRLIELLGVLFFCICAYFCMTSGDRDLGSIGAFACFGLAFGVRVLANRGSSPKSYPPGTYRHGDETLPEPPKPILNRIGRSADGRKLYFRDTTTNNIYWRYNAAVRPGDQVMSPLYDPEDRDKPLSYGRYMELLRTGSIP